MDGPDAMLANAVEDELFDDLVAVTVVKVRIASVFVIPGGERTKRGPLAVHFVVNSIPPLFSGIFF